MLHTNNRDKVDEIKSCLDIVDVIKREIDLRHTGNGEYVGSVPPVGKSGSSLKVDQKAQLWHDMKNGKGGDVLDWIAYRNGFDARGADFPAVLQIAAELAGVELEEMTEEENDSAKEKADIHNLFTEAAEIYHNNLTPELYDFIMDKWGINRETVDKLKIGYATTSRDLKDLDKMVLKKSGLVYSNNGMIGGEVFQGRIIFPYWKSGKVVYLIGRETDETPEAERERRMKYKKLLVHKVDREYVSPSVQNSYFYGEDSLRGSDYCIITEGVADCIAMLQAGFNCISPVTVQFREKDHPKLLSLTKGLKRVYICNDNEANQAGLKGALSTAEVLVRAGVEARLIKLHKPETLDKIDIADYMKEHTSEDFKELMGSSRGLYDYILEQQVIPEKSPDRLRAFKAFIKNDLGFMQDDEWKVFVNKEVLEKFDLTAKYVKNAVEEAERERQNRNKKEEEARNTENEETRLTSRKILEVSQQDIRETLGMPNLGNLDLCEVEKYHVETCQALHLKGYDIFGNPDYNTANYRAGNTGLFFYDPKRVYVTEWEDGESRQVFDHWAFTEEELSPTPITVVDSARNIDSDYGEILYTLQVKNEYGEINTFTEHKNTLFTKKGILDLINKNFCVTDTSSLTLWKIQEYLKTLLYGNADIIPRTLAAESTGWKDAGKYFVIGNKAYSEGETLDIHMLDSYTEQIYKPTGDPKKYFSGIKEVLDTFPVAQFMIYASCASPLLSLLGLDSVVVFLRGQSTTGKTKLCKLAVSPFTYLTKVAESTKSYQELDTAQNDGLPTFYDEASGNEERLNKIIYMLAGGTGKGRATEFGKGVNHGKTWKTVVIYNGENPILTQADNVGKFVRVIEIKNPVEKSPENKVLMDRIEETCSENHGWLADPFLKEVFRRKKEIPAIYERNLQKFGKSNDAGERLKRYFAAFATAGEMLEGIFKENGIKTLPAFDVVDMFFKEVVLGRPIEDEYRRALKIVMNWTVSNEGLKVINTTSPEKSEVKPAEVWAWITEPQTKELKTSSSERICFIPAKLRQLLEEQGFNPDKIIEAWAEKGLVDSKRRKKDGIPYGQYVTELQKNVNGRTITAVKIIYDNALEELDLVEHPVLKMPGKTPLQEMKAIVKTLSDDRFKRGIRDTKEALVNHTLEMFPKTYARKDIEFVVEGLCRTGEILAMPSV